MNILRQSVTGRSLSLVGQKRWCKDNNEPKPLFEGGPMYKKIEVPRHESDRAGIPDQHEVGAEVSQTVTTNLKNTFEAASDAMKKDGGFSSYTQAVKTLSGFAKGDVTKAKSGAWGPAGEGMTDEKDYSTYMRSKDEKFGTPPPELDLNKEQKPSSAHQQQARDVALDYNPFGGTSVPVASFMDYVESEQDFIKGGMTAERGVELGRMQARRNAEKSASQSRTSEVLGMMGQNTIHRRTSKRFNTEPLMIASWDMNSWTLSNGVRVVGSMILFQDSYYCWDVASVDDITLEKMMPIAHLHPVPVFIIMGIGAHGSILHPDISMYLRTRGTRINIMDAQTAVASYNQNRGDNYPCAGVFLCNEPTNGFDLFSYNQHWKKQRDIASGDHTPDSGLA
eukprot:TRINITY_DN13866_c0_g1_i2.p1 TRINITY_DN13866_c0_g1~~TRINITY_DN13866_c0_g1_i2.p1  ORF type:complete len:394 (+),score=50.23 TRINITY_DN13866_c0_g1_i2:77-1258(+)